MIGRIAFYAALAGIAAATAAVQLDRQAAIVPAYATAVPEPARGFAQAQIAARAVRSGKGQRAIDEAKLLVERRPIPAEAIRLLAQAQLTSGQAEKGFLTIQYAAQRGWRDPVAQEAMLRLALAAGDEEEAARRYTALFLKNSTEDALLNEFGAELFGEEKGPAILVLADIVSASERWPDTFLRRGVRVLPPQAFAAVVQRAAAKGASFACADLRSAAMAVARRDAQSGERLEEVVRARC